MANCTYCNTDSDTEFCPFSASPPQPPADWEEEMAEDEAELMTEEADEQTPDVADVIVDEDDYENEWMKFDLRDPDALSMYGYCLERDEAPIPPLGKGEKACYYLGRLMYAHVYALEDDDEIKIDLRQWYDKVEEDAMGTLETNVTSVQGLVLNWAEWKRILFYRKQLARNINDIMAERFVEERYELGKNKFISASWPFWCLTLRNWFQKNGSDEFFPGKMGISLKFTQYERLMLLTEDLLRFSKQHQDRHHGKKTETRETPVKKVNSRQQPSAIGIKRKAEQCDEDELNPLIRRRLTTGELDDFVVNTSSLRRLAKKRRIED